MLQTRKLPGVEGAAASQTATVNMPVNLSYYGILWTLSSDGLDSSSTLGDFDEIRIKANGKTIYQVDPVHQNRFNSYMGIPRYEGGADEAQLLWMPFIRPGLLDRAEQELTVIGMGYPRVTDPNVADYNPIPITTMQAEIDIGSGFSGGVVRGLAVLGTPRPVGTLRKLKRFYRSISGSGDYQISDLPKGELIDMIAMNNADDIDAVRIERNGYTVYNRTAEENRILTAVGVRKNANTPYDGLSAAPTQTSVNTLAHQLANPGIHDYSDSNDWWFVDPAEFGYGAEAMSTNVNDLRITISAGAAITNLDVYVAYLGGLGGL